MSFGWMSSVGDVHAIIGFLRTCFLHGAGGQNPSEQSPHGQNPGGQKTSGQNPTSTVVKSNLSGHNPEGHNCSGHDPGGQDPTFSLNAHCSIATPSAADPNRQSPVHSTESSGSLTHRSHKWYSQHTDSNSHPLEGYRTHAQSADPQKTDTVSRGHIQSAGPQISPQEVAVQTSSRSAWLQQLPWVRCGDAVTAWPAAQDESQRLTSHSRKPCGGQPGGLPMCTSVPPCRQPAPSEPSASESAFQLVLHSDFQHGSESQTLPGSLQHPIAACQHHLESQPCCSQGSLEGIWVYPIKSCGGSRVTEWPLGPNGLLLDREWALVGDDGHVLTQKGLPKLALVQPRVDLLQGFMQVRLACIGTDVA